MPQFRFKLSTLIASYIIIINYILFLEKDNNAVAISFNIQVYAYVCKLNPNYYG